MAENSLIGLLNDDVAYLETLIENQKNEAYFYFKVKIIVNKNNSLTLADKVIGIGKSNIFVFWAPETQSAKNQTLNTSKKQQINFDLLEFPQQKIPLAKFDQFSLIPNTDPQFVSYLKSIIPSFSSQQYPNVCQSFSLLFLKSTQQFETQSILCPRYTTGLQILYVLQMMKSIKSYEEFLEKYESYSGYRSLLLDKGNLRLMRMMCNVKFGFLDADPQNFGFNCQKNYEEIQEKREMLLYEQTLSEIMKKSQYQFADTFHLRIYFKIIDEESKTYATNFIIPVKDKIETFYLSGCQLTDQTFETLMLKIKNQSPKGTPFLNRSLPEKLYFPTLKYLNLQKNKLTDQIFSVLSKLISPEKEKVQKENNPSSSSIRPLFPALISVNLSKNDISLQSQSSHEKLINVLENLSSFVLKIDFSHNKINSLDFFEKYFVDADHQAGVSSLPIEFIDLRGNSSISQSTKESFISNYLSKQTQLNDKFMTDIGFIIDLDEISCVRDKNTLKYLLLLQNYLDTQKENFIEQGNCFEAHFAKLSSQYDLSRLKSSQFQNQKRQITLTLSKSEKFVQKPLQFSSSIKTIRNSQLKSPDKIPEVDGRMLEEFSKTFYLKDYKMLSLMKNELIDSFKVNEGELQKTFSQLWDRKRSQQKFIIDLLQKVVNFIDFKGKDGIKTLDEERSINRKLQKLVGIIRRKGLEGHGSQLAVYLKHIRDSFIESYLVNNKTFSSINPIYDYLKSITTNYTVLYTEAKKQKQSFLNVDYLHLASCPFQELEKIFLDNKKLGLNEFNESVYDRFRYLLMDNVTLGRVLHLSETLIRELKLFPTKVIRDYDKMIGKDSQLKPFFRGKQRLTSRRLGSISNRMQILRLYSIQHYPFNSKLPLQSAHQGVMSCLNFPQTRYQQTISFIEVVNNFMAFLFYTPDTVSQQSVTYINYIVGYLKEVGLESLEDLEWKEFLVEEFYLHLISFRPERKLAKGVLLNVFQYFTARIICRCELERFILAYLLQNQTAPIEHSHLILNNLLTAATTIPAILPSSSINSQSYSLQQLQTTRQSKIQWIIPNQFLLNSFLNQGKLSINIRFDGISLLSHLPTSSQSSMLEVQLFVHQTTTIQQLIEMLLDSNNLYRQHIPLSRKDSLSNQDKMQQILNDCWLFEKINKFNKLQYFKPYQSYRYVGEIVSQGFENEEKIIFYLRKTTVDAQFHNQSYLCEQQYNNENQLLQLFSTMLSNLSMSIQLISKLPQNILISSFSKLTSNNEIQLTATNYILVVFSHFVYILYSIQLKTMKLQLIESSKSNQEQYELQRKQQLLQRIIEFVIDGKPNQINQKIIVNCKCFTIEQKLQIKSQVKDLIQQYHSQNITIKSNILSLVRSLGDLGFCQTLVSDSTIFILNNRFLIEGKLLEHTNESNEIVNVYSKLENVIFFNQIIDLQLKQQQNQQRIALIIKTMVFDDEGKQINVQEREIIGVSEFVFALYNQILAICRNIIHFDTELLYQIQQHGNGNCKNSNSLFSYHLLSKTKTNGLHHINEKLVSFNITRNKQNQSYEKIFMSKSKSTVVKDQKQVQKSFIKEEINGNEEIEVYSRKSSKRSIRSSVSGKKEFKKHYQNDNKNDIRGNLEKEDSSSLIPSRQSIYFHNQSSQVLEQEQSSQKLQQQSRLIGNDNELKTQDIIKSLEDSHHKPSEKLGQSREQVVVITNQQRRSRKQMPKRRSSREKDK